MAKTARCRMSPSSSRCKLVAKTAHRIAFERDPSHPVEPFWVGRVDFRERQGDMVVEISPQRGRHRRAQAALLVKPKQEPGAFNCSSTQNKMARRQGRRRARRRMRGK